MSLGAMRWAWTQQLPPTSKLVLLALAESVNRRGKGFVCWPSASRLTELTGLSRRAVFTSVGSLEKAGLIERESGHTGRATTYRLRVEECGSCTSAADAPVQQMHGGSAADARGSAGDAPQSGMNQERNQEEKHRGRVDDAVRQEIPVSFPEPVPELPHWLPSRTWSEFLEHRRKLKAPMTDMAERRAIRELERLRSEGHDPEQVLGQSIVNGWKGVFPLRNAQGNARLNGTIRALESVFEVDDGEGNVSAGNGVSRGSLRPGGVQGAGGGLLGPAGWPAR